MYNQTGEQMQAVQGTEQRDSFRLTGAIRGKESKSADFINCVCFGRQAEQIIPGLKTEEEAREWIDKFDMEEGLNHIEVF